MGKFIIMVGGYWVSYLMRTVILEQGGLNNTIKKYDLINTYKILQ